MRQELPGEESLPPVPIADLPKFDAPERLDQGYRIRRHRKPREKTVHRQWVMTGACKPR